MTEPHQTILTLLTKHAWPLSLTSVVLWVSEQGHTQDAVRDAISALVKAGKLERKSGRLCIVEA